AKNGISSCELARSIGVTQKTAWFMEHRIREAMKRGSFAKMEGTVEVDETAIGAKAKTMHADKRREMRERGFPKTIVLGMRERGGEVRTMVVPNTTAETLQSQIVKNVEAGSKVYTDTWKGYNGMSAAYMHATVNHKAGQYVDGDVTTNGMEGYWNLLKRGYRGTYVQFSPQHTHRYLAEEDFRYNTRQEEDGDRFAQIVASVAGKRLTYRELTESHLVNLDRG
ncbi:MAG TPA: IS1595 family transposase, partial [Chthonomonadaceae bacterium]|nr:IS1595 family transposase [Chthonomonadaceae bacterium]